MTRTSCREEEIEGRGQRADEITEDRGQSTDEITDGRVQMRRPCPYRLMLSSVLCTLSSAVSDNTKDNIVDVSDAARSVPTMLQLLLTRSFNLSVLTFPFISYPLRPTGSSP